MPRRGIRGLVRCQQKKILLDNPLKSWDLLIESYFKTWKCVGTATLYLLLFRNLVVFRTVNKTVNNIILLRFYQTKSNVKSVLISKSIQGFPPHVSFVCGLSQGRSGPVLSTDWPVQREHGSGVRLLHLQHHPHQVPLRLLRGRLLCPELPR